MFRPKDDTDKAEAYDPWSMKSVIIHYNDGSSYQVFDRDNNIDNTSYICGGIRGKAISDHHELQPFDGSGADQGYYNQRNLLYL